MPTTTTNLGLLQPVGGDNPNELRLAISGNASTIDPYSLLTSVVTNTTNANVTRGQSVIASPSTTQTLPSATAGALVAITASSTVTGAAPVTVSGTQIYGVGLSAATSFTLGTAGAHAVLQSDGTHWYVVGGQQDSGWVALSLGSFAFSADSRTPSARLQGDTVRLKGALTPSGGSPSTWATISVGLRPPVALQIPVSNVTANTLDILKISTAGVMTLVGTAGVWFDGVTYEIN